MDIALDLSLRLLAAAGFAALIGYERELRAKGAGIRTHVLLALGAALFMIVSQYGFEGADKFDASRVAAGVVGGLGFLGNGTRWKARKLGFSVFATRKRPTAPSAARLMSQPLTRPDAGNAPEGAPA
jgi:hypothetical protein